MRKKGWDVNLSLYVFFILFIRYCVKIGSFLGRKDILSEKEKKGVNI